MDVAIAFAISRSNASSKCNAAECHDCRGGGESDEHHEEGALEQHPRRIRFSHAHAKARRDKQPADRRDN